MAHVEILVTRPPSGWPASDDPLDWCPRVEALAARRPVDRQRSLAADRLLSLLCDRWHVGPHAYEPDGRPTCGPGAHLTASHDGAYVVAAISDEPVGVDVVDCQRNTRWVVRIMSADEQVPDADEQSRGRAWAVREAALKWAGTGMSIDPRALTVTHAPGDPTAHLDRWWTVTFPDGRTVPVASGAVGDHALALAAKTPLTIVVDHHDLT
ncbi:MAG: 4'-phosphopantetheinyl transferase superfamily protein [Micrococcales bacterium]|nr:4'-phosphopantetheinyl transferase superfamily protein [Micrococcales bacterium]